MTYGTIHQRLALKARGECIRCGEPAKEWALKHDASERLSDATGTFSPHERDYEPLCVKCHRHADGNAQTMWDRHYDYLVSTRLRGAAHGCAKLTAKQVEQIKARRTAGEKLWKLSSAFGVSMAQISRIAHGQSCGMRKSLIGFTLVELLIVVAIVAILSAIALPQYMQYTIRSRLTEAVLIASQCRTAISEVYQVGGVIPGANGWNCGEGETKTKYVATLATSPDGVVTITTSNDTGLGVTAGKQLTLTPLDANGAALTAARIPVHVAGFRCAPVDIPVKYLPTACQ